MNIFFWRKNPIIDEFATKLANEIYNVVPPNQAIEYFSNASNKNKVNKIKAKLDKQVVTSVVSIKHFKTRHELGIYGKARLHMKFGDRLKELGYDETITKHINELLLINTP